MDSYSSGRDAFAHLLEQHNTAPDLVKTPLLRRRLELSLNCAGYTFAIWSRAIVELRAANTSTQPSPFHGLVP